MCNISRCWSYYNYYCSADGFLVASTVLALISFCMGCVGVGLFVPFNSDNRRFNRTMCHILDHEYDPCTDQNDPSEDTCYVVTWSVQYYAWNKSANVYVFSTIRHSYRTPLLAVDMLNIYKENTFQPCYYHRRVVVNVHWEEPIPSLPFLIMMCIGFSFSAIYVVVIGTFLFCQRRKRYASIVSIQ